MKKTVLCLVCLCFFALSGCVEEKIGMIKEKVFGEDKQEVAPKQASPSGVPVTAGSKTTPSEAPVSGLSGVPGGIPGMERPAGMPETMTSEMEYPAPARFTLGFKQTYQAVVKSRGMAVYEYAGANGDLISMQVIRVNVGEPAENVLKSNLSGLIMAERGQCEKHERDGDMFFCRNNALRDRDEYHVFMGKKLTDRFVVVGQLTTLDSDPEKAKRFSRQ